MNKLFYNSLARDYKINNGYDYFQKRSGYLHEIVATIRLNTILIVPDKKARPPGSSDKSGLPDGVIYRGDIDYCNGYIMYNRAFAFDPHRGKK